MNVHAFGDQTADQLSLLRKIVSRRDNSLLSSFLERSAVALREEIEKLPKTQRAAIPDFLTLSQLVEASIESSSKLPEIEGVLVTVSQLGHFIGYYCENPQELPSFSDIRAVGLCTGLLAASAVACAKSLSDLLPLAVEAVRISFRIGTTVRSTRDVLESASRAQESWSTIVSNTSEQIASGVIDAFHESNSTPTSKRAYVSAVSAQSVTISGPPSTTAALFKTSAFQNTNRINLPIYSPYHASHLFAYADATQILDKDTKANLRFFSRNGALHSAATGESIQANSAAEIFELVIDEILRQQVRLDFISENVVSQITAAAASASTEVSISVSAIGVGNLAASLVSALGSAGVSNVTVKDHTNWSGLPQTQGRPQHDKIAIVGMSGRFPGAANADQLWQLLEKGLDVHREIPSDRFDAKAHYDPTGKGKNKSHTPFGCFIDEPGLFDPRFFNMSPREAAQTDPMGRLALVTAYEALEMSGYVPNRTPSTRLTRVGTFYGQTSDDWREINASENIDTYFITGGVRAFAPGRINYYFKFSGPSFSVDTACSSSLAAIQLACTSLWAGDCDTACAGGLNVLTNPDIFSGLSKGQFLSKTGSCKTYDNDADGYCRGDGCGTIVLKRYQDAIADNDNILACILGAATNHSAEAVSITHPHAGAQEFLYKKVLEQAGVDAHDISYVEMHGTGTQAGDGIEMTSVTNTFAPRNRQRRQDQPLYLGAVKANIGHGEAASGINSLAKVLMMLRKNAIPANVGIKGVINKSFPQDLGKRMVNIPTSQVSFPRNGAEPRRVFLNNFSAAGGNTAIVMEDGPIKSISGIDSRSTHIVAVTARSIASLKRNIVNMIQFLDENPQATLASLSYTSTARRIQHNYRVAFTATEIEKVQEGLRSQIKDSYSPIAMVSTKVAFTFTGQGSQYTGLGQQLYQDLKTFRADIDQLNGLAILQGFPSFIPLINGTDVSTLSPVVVQLGMSCIQVALARMWAAWGITPIAVIGHSLGEYAALHVAGVISASDMILLVGRRAQLLESDCTKYTHGMLAVKASVDTLEETLGTDMPEVACINGPEETVLCGDSDVISKVSNIIAPKNFKSTKLNVPYAFHSAQVDPILEAFKKAASVVTFNKPTVPVLSPLTSDVIRETGIIGPDYLARHAREPVNFWAALSQGQDEKVFDEKTAWIEIGAHPVCSGMVKSCLEGTPTTAPSLRRNENPWKTIANSLCALFLAGVAIDFNEYHREFQSAHELLTLPTYSFDNKKYWLDYHNNWTLTKGETRPVVEKVIEAPAVELPSKLSTTSCQKIVFEELHANSGTVIVRSNMADPKLSNAVTGHKVNGSPLCPSSLYADMAMTVANYMYKELRPAGDPVGFDVCQMEVHKPLVAIIPSPPEGQWLEMEANADLDARSIHLKFRTVTPEGKLLVDHGHGLVKLGNPDAWLSDWNRSSYMVQTQIDLLDQKMQVGSAHKILRGMAYKLFKQLVDYAEPFRGMQEVVLDGKNTEASATVKFQNTEKDGDYFCAPFWIDSLAHISGFIVNATDTTGNDLIYISHGWESIKFAKTLSQDKTYRTYVRMLPQPRNIFAGDVYIFDGEEIVGLVRGLKFQGVTKKMMDVMVPPPKTGNAVSRPIAAAPVSAPTPAPAQVLTSKAVVSATSNASTERRVSIQSAPAMSNGQVAKSSVHTKVEVKTNFTKTKKVQKAAGGAIVSRVMQIIAEETAVDMSELVEEAAFDNLGVDSLLSLTISAKFREDLDLEISSTLFTDFPTIGQMKKFFAQYDGDEPLVEVEDSASDSTFDAASPYEDDGVSTPISSAPSTAPSVCDKEEISKTTVTTVSTTSIIATTSGPSLAKMIIAQEMGVAISEITDKADLAEMGMDSLMSLAILGAIREQTGIDVPSTFLVANATIEDIENALGMRVKPQETAVVKAKAPKPQARRPNFEKVASALTKISPKIRDVSMYPQATSALLQGNARIATKKLFLVPDGSGSATSYVSIPNIAPDIAVYGLNCPFMRSPADFTLDVGVRGVSTCYLNEIRRRQPTGPYLIGGWSAGGVFAYEVSQQLTSLGEKVERLVLIDSPCPVELEPLPPTLHLFFDKIGLLGTGKIGGTPSWLLPHFASTIAVLSDYEPTPFEKGQGPPTTAIWCRSGVCPNPTDPRPSDNGEYEPAPMKWLLNNRTDFTDNGWAKILPDTMEFSVMEGNHFTMMKEPHAGELGNLIRDALRVKA